MTPEKAKEIIYNEWQRFLNTALDYAGISDAYNMAIKALEQMSVIEDIKEEIEAKAKEREFYLDSGHPYDGLYEALEIINKHLEGTK